MPPKKSKTKVSAKKKKSVSVESGILHMLSCASLPLNDITFIVAAATYITPVVLPPVSIPKSQALHFAVATSNCSTLSRMVTHYNFAPQLTTTDVNGSTPLHTAAKKGDIPMIKLLLSYGLESEYTIIVCLLLQNVASQM